MKKEYSKPAMKMRGIECDSIICFSINDNAGLSNGEGSSEPGRAPQYSVWDDDEDELKKNLQAE